MSGLFPEDSAARKEYPVYSGFLRYFPAAVAAVAHHSFKGNEKHNPGQPLHWDRAKSDDEADAMLRHLMEHEVPGLEGELVAHAWRAMAMLQKYRESQGAPVAPAARLPSEHHAVEAPMPAHMAVMLERSEDDDTPEAALNFDKGAQA